MRVLVCCASFLSLCLARSVFVCVTVVLAVSAYVLSNKTFSRWIFLSENYKDQRFIKLGNTTLSLSTLSLSLLYLCLLTALILLIYLSSFRGTFPPCSLPPKPLSLLTKPLSLLTKPLLAPSESSSNPRNRTRVHKPVTKISAGLLP